MFAPTTKRATVAINYNQQREIVAYECNDLWSATASNYGQLWIMLQVTMANYYKLLQALYRASSRVTVMGRDVAQI